MERNPTKKELEKYLSDLSNLIDTGWFNNDQIKDCVFYHKEMTLKQFVSLGRRYLSQSIKDLNEIEDLKIKILTGIKD